MTSFSSRIWIMVVLATSLTISSTWAQGNGPTQPEVSSFKPIGVGNSVNPSTGDFSYEVPLFDIGGYPISLSYSAGRSMDEQASCVGLGWNLNCGVITRNMRGLPDDFKGDQITKRFNMRENNTFGVNFGLIDGSEFAGVKIPFNLKGGVGIEFNTYRGLSTNFTAGISPKLAEGSAGNSTYSLGVKSNSIDGLSTNFSAGIGKKYKGNMSMSMSARDGLNDISLKLGKEGSSTLYKKEHPKTKEIGTSSLSTYSGGGVSFAQSNYTPYSELPLTNFSFTGKFKPGVSFFFMSPQSSIEAYGSFQKLAYNEESSDAFGTMYLQHSHKRSLLDFNREKDGSVDVVKPSIDIPFLTPDIFSVNGHGFTGAFQLKRADVGLIHDKFNEILSGSFGAGYEVSSGNAANLGIDITPSVVISNSGIWENGNQMQDKLPFVDENTAPFNTEPAYFMSNGEMTVHDKEFSDKLGGFELTMVDIEKLKAKNELIGPNYSGMNVNDNAVKSQREKRNNLVSYLTAEEASHAGVQKELASYPRNKFMDFVPGDISIIGRTEGERKSHHISEITALKGDGLRYVFGLPAYNWVQKDISFNVGENPISSDGTVEYTLQDMGFDNQKGIDRYFMETSTPAYAHSFLLSSVLSKEFVDISGDGPTTDDLGDYVKFNYTKEYDRFKWRTPHQEHKASCSVGLLADKDDNKGTIMYGEKEYWYVHSVESKTQIAEFYYSERYDLKGVIGVNGGYDNSQKLYKLDSIRVFSLPDRRGNGASATPLKTILFKSDYELYSNLPGNDNPDASTSGNGKLTLKSVGFNYEHSRKGSHSAYTFEYNNKISLSPPLPLTYEAANTNNWGGYKTPSTNTTREEFPYVIQGASSKAMEDLYAGVGNIKKIGLPSGGSIGVEYESDDYAYVQDQVAMNFVNVQGFKGNAGGSDWGDWNLDGGLPFRTPKNIMTFRLKAPITGSMSSNEAGEVMYKDYLAEAMKDGRYLLVKSSVNMMRSSILTGQEFQEWVKTWAKVKGYGVSKSVSSSSDYDMGWIELEDKCLNASDDPSCPDRVNPIMLEAFQTLRLNLPKIAFGISGDFQSGSLGAAMFMSMWSHIRNVLEFAVGPNAMLFAEQKCKSVAPNRTFVRLNTPDGRKLGGGHRVKSIHIDDEFSAMTAGIHGSSQYTTVYSYDQEDDRPNITVRKPSISSGVAEYEPMVGGEENPLKQPEIYGKGGFLKVNNNYYLEHPYGETQMPGGGVVYRKVTTKSVVPSVASKQGAGWQIEEFFTAKDFPLSYDKTPLKIKQIKASIWVVIANSSVDLATFSQGFRVELNDMHGKPKKSTAFANNGVELNSTLYHYQTALNNPKKLNNTVKTINHKGEYSDALIGIDHNVYMGCRSADHITVAGTVKVNFNVIIIPLIIPVPVGVPNFGVEFSADKRKYLSISMLKVIRRNGILHKVEAKEDGASVSTENLAYDAETGQILLTKTKNEFRDDIYNLTMPAHWAYPEMGGAYKNIRGSLGSISIVGQGSTGLVSSTNAKYLQQGDILYADEGGGIVSKLYVTNIGTNTFNVVKEDGSTFASAMSLQKCFVMRSGYSNSPSSPIQTITSLANPFVNGKLNLSASTKILNATAVEYDRLWQRVCTNCNGTRSGTNHFRTNYYGHWRPKVSWAFANKRTTAINENNVVVSTLSGVPRNLRRDGIYDVFTPFWHFDYTTSNKWQRLGAANYYSGAVLAPYVASQWVRANQLTKVHPQGNSIESKDALDQYSAQTLGYMNTQVIAEAKNAAYNQIGYDGFEDLLFEARNGNPTPLCGRHFSPRIAGMEPESSCVDGSTYLSLLSRDAHTGSYSIKVGSQSPDIFYSIGSDACQPNSSLGALSYPSNNIVSQISQNGNVVYSTDCDCLGEVSLTPGKYVVSAWVKPDDEDCTLRPEVGYANMELFNLDANSPSQNQTFMTFYPSGPRIEGWQRIYGELNYEPTSVKRFGIRFSTNLSGILVDDIRLHPYDASFKSYVYDEKNLRLTHELDANNFFTKYEYDQQGQLERVKKETERGVMMVKESRFGAKKK